MSSDESYIPPGRNLCRSLKRMRQLEHFEIGAMRAHNLQTDWQATSCKTAGYGNGRRTCKSNGITGSHPIDVGFHRLSVDLSDPLRLNRKWSHLRNGQNEKV